MPETTNGKRTYMALGLMDFLAFYVPGLLTLFFIFALVGIMSIEPDQIIIFINELSDDRYIRGSTWTILSLIGPYVIGQLIFPIGYQIARLFLRTNSINDVDLHGLSCPFLSRSEYCTAESLQFAYCLLRCFNDSTVAYNDLMITRFRTLSRFCRSMLFPTLLLSVAFIFIGIGQIKQENGGLGAFIILTAFLSLSAFWGLGQRYRRYEIRWRNGICVAGGEQLAEKG